MRQADIQVGAVLYWNDNNDWAVDKGQGNRVVVIDNRVAHWVIDSSGNHYDHGCRVRNPYGIWTVQGVVVEVQGGVGRTRKEVAPIRQLRGTWEFCQEVIAGYRAEREKAQAALRKESEAQEAERSARMARGRAALSRLEAWGVKRGRDAHVVEDMVSIRADVLEALMDALPMNWTYEE